MSSTNPQVIATAKQELAAAWRNGDVMNALSRFVFWTNPAGPNLSPVALTNAVDADASIGIFAGVIHQRWSQLKAYDPYPLLRKQFDKPIAIEKLKKLFFTDQKTFEAMMLLQVVMNYAQTMSVADLDKLVDPVFRRDRCVAYLVANSGANYDTMASVCKQTHTFQDDADIEKWKTWHLQNSTRPAAPTTGGKPWGIENKTAWSLIEAIPATGALNMTPAGWTGMSADNKTLQECADICDKDNAKCAGFTWKPNYNNPTTQSNPNSSKGSCFFKSDVTSQTFPSSNVFRTLTNPNFRNPATTSTATNNLTPAQQASLAALQSSLGAMAAALSSAGTTAAQPPPVMYATNADRMAVVMKTFELQMTTEFPVSNKSNRKNGPWKGSEILNYLRKSKYPASLTDLYVPKGSAFVTDWKASGATGDTPTQFTVQWRSSDHNFLYECTVTSIPAGAYPLPTSQQATVNALQGALAGMSTAMATAGTTTTTANTSTTTNTTSTAEAQPSLPSYAEIASVFTYERVHEALAMENKRALAGQWNEQEMAARIPLSRRREIVASSLFLRLGRGSPVNDLDVYSVSRNYLTPSVLGQILQWGGLIQAWKDRDVLGALTLENFLSSTWQRDMQGVAADGVVQLWPIKLTYDAKTSGTFSSGAAMSMINGYLAGGAPYEDRARARALAIGLQYSPILLPPPPMQTTTTTTNTTSNSGTTAGTTAPSYAASFTAAAGEIADRWAAGDASAALQAHYKNATENPNTKGDPGRLMDELLQRVSLATAAKTVEDKWDSVRSLDAKYFATAFPKSAVLSAANKLYWVDRNPVDAMYVLNAGMARAGTVTESEANNLADPTFRRDQAVLKMAPANAESRARWKQIAIGSKTFVDDADAETWLRNEAQSIRYHGRIRTSKPSQDWGVVQKVTWGSKNPEFNVVPRGQSANSLSGVTLSACADACAKDNAKCAGFTFRPMPVGGTTGNCWFKSNVTTNAVDSSSLFLTFTNPDFGKAEEDVVATPAQGQTTASGGSIMYNGSSTITRGLSEDEVRRRARRNMREQSAGIGAMGWVVAFAAIALVVYLLMSPSTKAESSNPEGDMNRFISGSETFSSSAAPAAPVSRPAPSSFEADFASFMN
eukprot:jgi/Mesvir1/7758/Mv11701-RA.1